jgi:hypothetical protein
MGQSERGLLLYDKTENFYMYCQEWYSILYNSNKLHFEIYLNIILTLRIIKLAQELLKFE